MEKALEEWYKLHQFCLYSGGYETKELADYLGVSTRTIQRWIKGIGKPNEKESGRISRYITEKSTQNPL